MISKRALILALAMVLTVAGSVLAGEIHNAARDGNLAEVKRLLENDPSLVNAKDNFGATPLHWACARGHTEVAKYLVEKGAALNTPDAGQITPLHIAVLRGNVELTEFLLSRGADAQARTREGASVLHWAVRGRNRQIVNALLAQKLDVNVRDNMGNTPLLEAALWGADEMVRMLVENHGDANLRNSRGSSPLSVAQREDYSGIAEYLVLHGAKADLEEAPRPKGKYMGQSPPGTAPAVFAPGIVSTEKDQLNAAFTPDGKEFHFAVAEPGRGHRMYYMIEQEHGWTKPRPVPFASSANDVDMFVTQDGQKLFFCSTRPAAGRAEGRRDSDIYVVARTKEGWGTPERLSDDVNSDQNDYYPTLTRDGTLYFSSHRAGGFGENDIYRARLVSGRYQRPENLGPLINTPGREFDPFVAPDESYLIFASNRPGGFGEADLYISFRGEDGSWSAPRNMGKTINSSTAEFTPMLTPDGKYLFFTSDRAGVSDLYWVAAKVIRDLKQGSRPPER